MYIFIYKYSIETKLPEQNSNIPEKNFKLFLVYLI
jgi:hypothetical protein